MARHSDLRTLSDADLVLLIRYGLVDAPWGELDRRYRPGAVRAARSMLTRGGPAARAADEVAHDAMTKAYLKLDLYDESRPFWPWLSCLVRNHAIDWLNRRRRLHLPDLATVSAGGSPLDALAAAEMRLEARERLQQATANLPPREQALFTGFYINSASVASLAHAFGLAEGTVRGTLSSAKKRVMASLGDVKLTNCELKQLFE